MSYDPANVVVVEVNEDNETLAVYENSKLVHMERVGMDLGRITIAYSEKRIRIMKEHHWSDRIVRKGLERLARRERGGKARHSTKGYQEDSKAGTEA